MNESVLGYEAEPSDVEATVADIAATPDLMERYARATSEQAYHEAVAERLKLIREETLARLNRGDDGTRLSYEKIAELLLPGKSRATAQQMVERGRARL
ncbi:hypothetical protein [Nonomuraea wenchangensis]|uniref:hypothetical protein n=1 Tax=Nonomuraea wenchangensis TaxID=568860 RepID=UPI003318878E